MLEQIAAKAPLYFLIAVRVLAMILTVPLLSTSKGLFIDKLATSIFEP